MVVCSEVELRNSGPFQSGMAEEHSRGKYTEGALYFWNPMTWKTAIFKFAVGSNRFGVSEPGSDALSFRVAGWKTMGSL